MAVISGKNVAINGIRNGGLIEIQRIVRSEPVYHSAGKGGADRAEGNVDFVGRYLAWGHSPTIWFNQRFTLSFTLMGGSTQSGLTATDVLCTGLDIVVPTFDPNRRNAIYHIVYFGAGGIDLTASAATVGAADKLFTNKGLACTVAGVAQTCVQSMKWSFRVNTEPFVDSASNGVYNRAEGNLDWRFECRKTIDNMDLAPALNTVGLMKMEVTKTPSVTFWEATSGRVISVEGVNFDPATNQPLALDIVAEKCANAADGNVGTIKSPDGIERWPVPH